MRKFKVFLLEMNLILFPTLILLPVICYVCYGWCEAIISLFVTLISGFFFYITLKTNYVDSFLLIHKEENK